MAESGKRQPRRIADLYYEASVGLTPANRAILFRKIVETIGSQNIEIIRNEEIISIG